MKPCSGKWFFPVLCTLLAGLHTASLWGESLPGAIDFAEAARLAVAASEDLRNEYAQRAIREGVWRWSLRSYFPRLSLTASEDDRLSETASDSFLKSYGVNLEQLLWDGGRAALGRRIEKAELKLLGARLERMAQEIADAALSAYRNILFSRAALEIREASLESLEEQRRILERETELGLALEADLAEAGITVAEARLELLSLRLDLAEAERRLAESLGLESLPVLTERVDIREGAAAPSLPLVRSLAGNRNPDLIAARYSIAQKQEELQYAARSWIPSVKINGTFSLSGRQYPLTRYNWSVGISLDFSSPWFSSAIGASTGREPPFDRNARLQTSLNPLPDPGSALGGRSAKLALALEKRKYEDAFVRLGRTAETAVEQCSLADKKRALAVESLELSEERLHLAELRLELGQLTRLELMKTRLEHTKREIAAVEAAAAALEARRELERLLDLGPGELFSPASL